MIGMCENVRPLMFAASQLPVGGRTDVDDAPAPARNTLMPMMMMTMNTQMRLFSYRTT